MIIAEARRQKPVDNEYQRKENSKYDRIEKH